MVKDLFDHSFKEDAIDLILFYMIFSNSIENYLLLILIRKYEAKQDKEKYYVQYRSVK